MSFFERPVNFSLNIASPLSVMTHNSSVIFYLKQYVLSSKGVHQSESFFRTSSARVKICQIC